MRIFNRTLEGWLLRVLAVVGAMGLAAPAARAGVSVVVPASDGQALCDQTRQGSWLVQGLAKDEASVATVRRAIEARGLYGVATVLRPVSFSQLPYADNLVNHAEIDLDALGDDAPAREEILRILAPGGTATIKQAGRTEEAKKARPAGMDDWTHFDYNAAGTGVSQDKLVAPPTNIQWRSEAQEYIGLGGNPAGYRPYAGFRVEHGRAFAMYGTGKIGQKNAPAVLIARDALNGVPLWQVPAYSAGNGTPQEYQFVVGGDRVFTFLKADGPVVGLDAASGKVAVTFDKSGKLPGRGSKIHPAYIMFRYADGKLVETAENRLLVMDTKSGEVIWTHEEKEDFLCFPRVLEKERRVYVQVVESRVGKIRGDGRI